MAAERQGLCCLLKASLLLAFFLATAASQEAPSPFCSRIFKNSMYCFNIVDFNFVHQHLPADSSNFTTFVLKDSADLVLTAEDFKHPAFKELTELQFEQCNLNNINSGLFAGLTSLVTVDLESSNIHELNTNLFVNEGAIKTFDVSGNHIAMSPDSFKGMSNVESIDLESNGLTSIPHNLFVGLRELYILDLSNNELTSIDNETFNGLARLGYLDLSNNEIVNISPDAFSYLPELYHVLLLSNPLRSLPAEVFQHNYKMSTLDLTGSDLHQIENFPLNIPSLSVLEMSSCKIESIPADYFENLQGLTQINLMTNSIANLDSGVFKKLPHIFNIYLDQNNFTSINVDSFNGILDPVSENFYAGAQGSSFFTENPWDCTTSDMQAVKEYCLAHEMDFETTFGCNKTES